MNIAYLSTFHPYRGGIAQFNHSLKKALEIEHAVHCFTFKRQYPDILFPGKTQYVDDYDKRRKYEAQRVLDTINPFSYLSTAKKINQTQPDILIMKYWMSFFAPALGYVAGSMKPSTKVVAIIDNALPHEPKFFDKAFGKYFLNRVDTCIVMSEAVKQDIISLKPSAQCLYAPHPLYNHFGEKLDKAKTREQLGLDNDKKTLLFFGLIRDYKGLDILIDAFGELSSEYQLVIAGEPYGDFTKYEKQINSLPNASNVHTFAKYINDSEVPLYFSCADVCVLPYRSATQSGITSIAYHFDLPLIVTDVGGLGEYVSDGENGVVVSANATAIKQGIERYFATDREVFVENIRKMKDELSWERLAQKIVEIVDKT